jgi:hypothetical protein
MKNMQRTLLLCAVTLLLTLQSCKSQSFDEHDLIGTWTLENIEKEGGLDLSGVKGLAMETLGVDSVTETTDENPEIILKFSKDESLETIQAEQYFTAKYELNDSLLFLGDSQYKLEKLTQETMVMSKKGIGVQRFHYVKSDKDITDFKK